MKWVVQTRKGICTAAKKAKYGDVIIWVKHLTWQDAYDIESIMKGYEEEKEPQKV